MPLVRRPAPTVQVTEPVVTQAQNPPLPVPPPQSRADQAFVGTLAAIAAVLAVRLWLGLALIGAFVLAVRSDGTAGWWVLVAYSLLTVIPLVALDIITRQRGGR